MTAVVQHIVQHGLKPEWDRLELLCQCLIRSRENKEVGSELLGRLRQMQLHVSELRATGATWANIETEGLSVVEMDILSAVIAVEAEPKFALYYQRFYPGHVQHYMTPALLQELLAFSGDEVRLLHLALTNDSLLVSRGLITVENEGALRILKPGAGIVNRLLELPEEDIPPPGSLRIRDKAFWDDLILADEKRRLLQEYLIWIRHHETVVNEWQGNETGGPIALFAGPSGTGKTFAAMVLANELGWPLYRVDLGMLVSKYIGETEKNLNSLFSAAHGKKMVLQFDEADSLMSKRGDVREARDRYANMEVSHLLARIEEHRGPCILTTNLRGHLDTAFYRRFQVVVEFSRPDERERKHLWQKLFPAKAPLSKELDLSLLGRSVNLSGGNIKNAALHSAYLAAEEGSAIQYKHVATAVWRELTKDGRPVSDSQLGQLISYLPDGVR